MESIAKKPMTAGEKEQAYIDFFNAFILSDGDEAADKLNKSALARGLIDTALYLKAARILVQRILNC